MWGDKRALKVLERDYPCSLAVYLVTQGIYGYNGGDYWSEVLETTGFKGNQTTALGRAFERLIETFGLPSFYGVRQDAHRYISVILAHAGIPNYCLPDFFGNMLQPSILSERYSDMSADELIEAWRWESRARVFTDKPVMRFLTHGDIVAENFVERTREMALEAYDTGMLPRPEDVGLPGRVIREYRSWLGEQSVEQKRRESVTKWRLYKPEIVVDPWGEGLILELPSEQVPATHAQADIAWKLSANEEERTERVRVRRRGFDLRTVEASLVLKQPAPLYEVEFTVDGEVKRTWRYRGVDDKRPFIVFDAERLKVLTWQHSLPARYLGFLYPLDSEIEIEGEARKVQELQRLAWGWANYNGAIWDLENALKCSFSIADGEPQVVPVRQDVSALRPILTGGQLLEFETDGSSKVLYVGPPPDVHIPLPPNPVEQRTQEEELSRWRLVVRNRWPAVPDIHSRHSLSDFKNSVTFSKEGFNLSLGLPDLLGEVPFGNYEVRLRGPIGRDAAFDVRTVPHLVVRGHDRLCLPNSQGSPEVVTLTVETAQDIDLGLSEGARIRDVTAEDSYRVYEITVDSEVTEVEFTLARATPSGEVARVAVSVPIHRLQWSLSSEEAAAVRREWTGELLQLTVKELLDLPSPALLISLPLPEDEDDVHMELYLQDVDEVERQVLDPQALRGLNHLYRFDLTAFEDTLSALHSPVVRLGLRVWGVSDSDGPLQIPVLSLKRSLFVSDVNLTARSDEGKVTFVLRWCEDRPLKNRYVRLWPLWRPWEKPMERCVPDDAKGHWSFSAPVEELRSGKYRVEFFVSDPWVIEDMPSLPPANAPGTTDVELSAPAKQLEHLDQRIERRGEEFGLVLERGCVREEAGLSAQSRSDWQWCFEHLDAGSILQILAFADLTSQSWSGYRALQLKMSSDSRVGKVVDAYHANELSFGHFRRYFEHLPPPERWSKQTCSSLLTVRDEGLRVTAVQQLLKRESQVGVEAVLRWMRQARISDVDAVALVAEQPNFAIEHLQDLAGDPVAERLLEALRQTAQTEDAARVGDWVHCDAGWGRLTRIINPESEAELMWIAELTAPYRLYVTLRPAIEPEDIVIDLSTQLMEFTQRRKTFICSKCDPPVLMTQKNSIIRRHTAEAHPTRKRKRHGRVHYECTFKEPGEELTLEHLECQPSEPKNQLV
jgi:hypothetical protein